MKNVIWFLFLIIISINTSAQDTIIGKVFDEKNKPIPFASVILMSNDSEITKVGTSFEGDFTIILTSKIVKTPLDCYIKITYPGFNEYKSVTFLKALGDNYDCGNIILKEADNLPKVEVYSYKVGSEEPVSKKKRKKGFKK